MPRSRCEETQAGAAASEPPSDRPYRILSLDGGGEWAVVQALALIDLFGEGASGHEVLQRFDLVAGNSGGSVILACLAVDMRLSSILDLYTNETKRLSTFKFTTLGRLVQGLKRLHLDLPVGPRYSTEQKRAGLASHLGPAASVPLSEWRSRHPCPIADLLITAFDYDVQRAAMFRTNRHNLAGSSHPSLPPGISLLDAVHASTNAPVLYFDAPAQVQNGAEPLRRYWDGALAGYNNPVLAAVVDAIADRGRDGGPRPRPIQVVSIGSGSTHRPRGNPDGSQQGNPRFMGYARRCPWTDLEVASGAILDDPPDAATFTAHVALGGALPLHPDERVTAGPVVRMSPVVRPIRTGQDTWEWPRGSFAKAYDLGPSQFARLTGLPLDALAQADIELIMRFACNWLAGKIPNQPIRANEQTLDAEIGHDRYPAARRAVRAFGIDLVDRLR